MPLEHSGSKPAFKRNVTNLMHEVGKSPHVQSQAQALAIAYDIKRRAKRAAGGGVHLTRGTLISTVPGRTDLHKTHVPSGSYVIPADIVSGRGQGNTLAGAEQLHRLFKMPHQGLTPHEPKLPRAGFPRAPAGLSKGGATPDHHEGKPVRVDLAGGEVVVPPENLRAVVHKDLKTAHAIMDRWVLKERKKLRKTLAKLPGPVKGQ